MDGSLYSQETGIKREASADRALSGRTKDPHCLDGVWRNDDAPNADDLIPVEAAARGTLRTRGADQTLWPRLSLNALRPLQPL